MIRATLRRLLLATITIAVLGALPAGAGAAVTGVLITGDDGNWVPVTPGLTLRMMNAQLQLQGQVGNYGVQVVGPDGAVSAQQSCVTGAAAFRSGYRGNGVYTVRVATYSDTLCTRLTEQREWAYAINASVAIAPPPRAWPLRKWGSYSRIPVLLAFAGNPGQDSQELRFAKNAVLGPDGGIAGPSEEGFVSNGVATLPVRETGRYTVVARAKAYTAAGTVYSPWSAPVTVTVMAPFDFSSDMRLVDPIGPSYRMRGVVMEPSAVGQRVTIKIKRKGARRWRTLGRVKVRAGGEISKRFILRRPGTYSMRLYFRGSPTIYRGYVKWSVRISRRYV